MEITLEEVILLMNLVKAEYNRQSPGQNIIALLKKHNISIKDNLPMVFTLDLLYKKLESIQVLATGGKILE